MFRIAQILPGVLLVLLLNPVTVFSQKVVTGTIIDAETGETLPSVTLFDFELGEGTITNAAGFFELRLSRVPAKVDIRHLGYESQRIEITQDTQSKIEIQLVPVTYSLEEVVVSGEDPAYNIMRKVIQRKAEWQANLATYTAESYSRFLLYSDFDLAQVQETIAMHHWKKAEGTRSFVRARRMRPASASPMRFASTTNIPNFYDDIIEIFGFEMIGPTHPKATEVYTFTLGGHLEQDGKKVYDIYFSPKSGLNTAFIGHVLVQDEAYVLLKAQLRPSPDNIMPAPVQDWDVFYEQQYAPSGDSVWLPIDLHVEGHVSFGRLGVSYPTARYRQVSRLTKHAVNVAVPDSLFRSKNQLVIAANADRRDDLFLWNPGLIPMTPKEIEEVVGLDPKMSIGRSFRPIGVLANYTAINLSEDSEQANAATSGGLVSRTLARSRVDYNRVEGFYLGAGSDVKLARPLTLYAEGGYGLSSKLPAFHTSLRYDAGIDNKPSWFFNKAYLKVGLKDLRDTQYKSQSYSRFTSGLTTYIGWEDYFDYFERKSKYSEIGIRAERLKTTISLQYAREDHRSIEAHRDRKGWFFGNTRRVNPEIEEGSVSLFTGALEVGNLPTPNMRAGGNGIRLSAIRNAEYLTDFAPFTRYSLEAALTIQTFVKRRTWPNALYLRLFGATYTGTLPSSFVSALDVSRRPISPFGGFKTLSGLPIKGENVWAVYWEHDFATLLFELLGFWGVAQNGIGFTVHGAHGQALGTNRLKTIDLYSTHNADVQNELGISLTHFFNLPIRLDLTKNFKQNRLTIGIGFVQKL